ncbi:MAG: YkvA family protein [Chloroflexota bacterium]|nr:YkvA family protein [Chloroflexota bacterium]
MNRKQQRIFTILSERWEDLQVVWKLLLDDEVNFNLKLIPLLALLYLLSPIDLIPDLLLGPGQLDDVGLLLAALALFIRLAPAPSVARARRELGQHEDELDVRVVREDEER